MTVKMTRQQSAGFNTKPGSITNFHTTRNLDKKTEIRYLHILTVLYSALCVLSILFEVYVFSIWDAGEKLYILLVCGLTALATGMIGIYGSSLVKMDIEMKSSAVNVDNSELLLLDFVVSVILFSVFTSLGSEITFNTTHVEEGMMAGAYIAFIISAILLISYYFIL
jgi:hypothetical protein